MMDQNIILCIFNLRRCQEAVELLGNYSEGYWFESVT